MPPKKVGKKAASPLRGTLRKSASPRRSATRKTPLTVKKSSSKISTSSPSTSPAPAPKTLAKTGGTAGGLFTGGALALGKKKTRPAAPAAAAPPPPSSSTKVKSSTAAPSTSAAAPKPPPSSSSSPPAASPPDSPSPPPSASGTTPLVRTVPAEEEPKVTPAPAASQKIVPAPSKTLEQPVVKPPPSASPRTSFTLLAGPLLSEKSGVSYPRTSSREPATPMLLSRSFRSADEGDLPRFYPVYVEPAIEQVQFAPDGVGALFHKTQQEPFCPPAEFCDIRPANTQQEQQQQQQLLEFKSETAVLLRQIEDIRQEVEQLKLDQLLQQQEQSKGAAPKLWACLGCDRRTHYL